MEEQLDCQKVPCVETDDHNSSCQGVLLSHDIKYYAEKHKMISPFHEDNLKPAGIRLCLGKEYAMDGEIRELVNEPGKNRLTILPFQVAIINTEETINLPRFIIARWNLRVSLVYKGLLWTGALQVDPGWCGPLPCPIYNLSNEPVSLKIGDPIVLMDFVKTTPFIPGESKPYNRPPKRKRFSDYDYRLKSALFTEGAQRVKEVEKRIHKVESITGLAIASIAILFAALSVLVTSRDTNLSQIGPLHPWLIIWPSLSIGLSIFALYFSLAKLELKTWQRYLLLFLVVMICFFLAFIAYPSIEAFFVNILCPDSG